VTLPKDPLTEVEMSKKRKVSPKKPSTWKKSRANKPQSHNVLIVDDIDLIITVVADALEDILRKNEAKKETMYDRIKAELKGVQQALYSSHIVSTTLSSSEAAKLGDDPTQLQRIAYATEARLCRVQEEKEQATDALKQVKEESLE
jgi:hypothetical protein